MSTDAGHTHPPPIAAIEEEIRSEFEIFEDPMDRYAYIIDLGDTLTPLEEAYRTDEHLVPGCLSKVWLHAEGKGSRVFFQADSNTVITKGIVALLLRVLSGQKADDIIDARLPFIDSIGLRGHLSSQRVGGLNAMIKRMKVLAARFSGASDADSECLPG